MNIFVQLLQSWQMFYSTIAVSAATLTGLLFVSLSVNRQHFDDQARLVARRTFGNLLDVLILALIFLIPHGRPSGLCITLATFGSVRFLTSVAEAIRAARKRTWKKLSRTVFFRIALPLLFPAGIVLLSVGIYEQSASAMLWPVAIVVGLLASAGWNAWELLFKK